MYELVSDFSWYGGLLHLPWWGYVLVGLGDLYRETQRFEDAISSY